MKPKEPSLISTLFMVMCRPSHAPNMLGTWHTDDNMIFFTECEAYRQAALARVQEQGTIVTVVPASEFYR